MSPVQEAELCADYFDGGSFLLAGAEDRLGLGEDIEGAARDAWARLGRLYLVEGIGRRDCVGWLAGSGEPLCR